MTRPVVDAGYDELIERAQAAYAEDRLDHAVELFEAAEVVAREQGDQARADMALCRATFVRFDIAQPDPHLPTLKTVFLRNSDPRVRWTAAYYVAVGSDIAGDLDQASLWADRSAELANELADDRSEVRCRNLSGVLAARRGEFATAERAFRRALELQTLLDTPQPEFEAQITDNLGYSLMCGASLADGLACCEHARRELERIGARHLLYETLQDLCFGYILDDRLEAAQACGEQALDLAIEHSDQLVVKNCLFLLSEVAVRRGDTFRARRFLRELAAYYPEVGVSEELIDVFLQTDLTSVVNLRG